MQRNPLPVLSYSQFMQIQALPIPVDCLPASGQARALHQSPCCCQNALPPLI